VDTHSGNGDTAPAAVPRSSLQPARRRSAAAVFASILVVLAAISGYLVAVIAVQLDELFLPGNEIALPQAFKPVPGLSNAVPPPPPEAGVPPTPSPAANRINVLVLGLDRRPSEGKEPTRSDTIFVLTLDPATKTGGVLSIPRDLWVEIPDGRGGVFADRINSAYRYGGMSGYKGGPIQAAKDAIEHNFPQIRLDYTVVIDFASFIKIIDTLGGVEITITEGFRYFEPVSVDDRDGVIPVFRPGVERMNGVRALYYARFRDGPDGDLGRIRRQQQVMMAVADQLVSADALSQAPELWSRYKDAIDTDIPSYRIPGLALLARQVGLDRVAMRSLGEVTLEAHTAGGADVLTADPANLARVVGELFADPKLRQERAAVEIQNATAKTGLAASAAGLLVQHGLVPEAISVSAVTPTPRDETTILNLRGKDYTAERLAQWLGVPAARVKTVRDGGGGIAGMPGSGPAGPGASTAATGVGPDIVVILGRDAKVPAPANGRALAR
jgi:LCP family protein required for cell wall assembly